MADRGARHVQAGAPEVGIAGDRGAADLSTRHRVTGDVRAVVPAFEVPVPVEVKREVAGAPSITPRGGFHAVFHRIAIRVAVLGVRDAIEIDVPRRLRRVGHTIVIEVFGNRDAEGRGRIRQQLDAPQADRRGSGRREVRPAALADPANQARHLVEEARRRASRQPDLRAVRRIEDTQRTDAVAGIHHQQFHPRSAET